MNPIVKLHNDSKQNLDILNKKQSLTYNSEIKNKNVLIDFSGESLSSDAGVLLLGEVEQQINIIRSMTDTIPDNRNRSYIKHTLTELLTQRIAQIVCGYEDANDCNDLRNDPIFQIITGRCPEIGNALASQPTMSRFENSIYSTTLYRLALVFMDQFIASYDKSPSVIVLDFDDTEDKVFGNQASSLYTQKRHLVNHKQRFLT